MRILIALAAAVMLLGSTLARAVPPGPPVTEPVDVFVTNPNVPVTVVPSWTGLEETLHGNGAIIASGPSVGGAVYEFTEDAILTHAFFYVDSYTDATAGSGSCFGQLEVRDSSSNVVLVLARIGVSAQKSTTQVIPLPNLYVESGYYLWSEITYNDTGKKCLLGFNVLGKYVPQS